MAKKISEMKKEELEKELEKVRGVLLKGHTNLPAGKVSAVKNIRHAKIRQAQLLTALKALQK